MNILEVYRSSILDQHLYHSLCLVMHGGIVKWCLSSAFLDSGVSAADQQVLYHGDVSNSGGKVEAGTSVGGWQLEVGGS